jgi:hypothetical protein
MKAGLLHAKAKIFVKAGVHPIVINLAFVDGGNGASGIFHWFLRRHL